jgi:hypothetical protein
MPLSDDKKTIDQLILVYKADSGAFSAFVDSAKKLLMINGCSLCSITHGLTGEKSEWRHCREELGVPVDYVHRDEVDEELHRLVGDQLPCIVAEAGGERTVLLGPEVLQRCRGSVADLKGRINYFASLHRLELPQQVG